MKTILLLVLTALLSASCNRHKTAASQPTTQTIAPAEGQPAPNGSDTMTQTVEVDDSRSESDGMTTTASTPAAKTTTKAPAKKKGKK